MRNPVLDFPHGVFHMRSTTYQSEMKSVGIRKRRKVFFFEKKKQKTFVQMGPEHSVFRPMHPYS